MSALKNADHKRRRTKLVDPRFQLRLVAVFFGLSALALLLQFLLIARNLGDLSARMSSGGEHLAQALPGLLLRTLAVSFGVMLPLTLVIGVLVTFRYAGPLFRIRRHLEQVARGDDIGPCCLREGDELQDLCDLVNAALDTASGTRASGAAAQGEPDSVRRAG